jgi:predicted Zn-dependent protease
LDTKKRIVSKGKLRMSARNVKVFRPLTVALFFAAVSLHTFSSCTASKPEAGPEEAAAKLSPEDKQKLEDYKAEVEIGRNMAGRLLQFYGTYGDEGAIAYVNQVGNYVASYGDYPDRKYMFAILDTEAVNAFACPGGYILVTMGTLRGAKTEAELAAILGHESAHVGKQHMFNTLKAMEQREMEKIEKENDKKGKVKVPYEAKVRERPKPESKSELASLIIKMSGAGGGAAFSILQAAKAGMSVMMEKGLDKKLEFEADHEGVKYAIRAGYDPKAMNDFLGRLEKKKKSLNMKVLSKTHPSIKERKKHIDELLAEMKASEIIGADGKERFQEFAKNLPEAKEPKEKK